MAECASTKGTSGNVRLPLINDSNTLKSFEIIYDGRHFSTHYLLLSLICFEYYLKCDKTCYKNDHLAIDS